MWLFGFVLCLVGGCVCLFCCARGFGLIGCGAFVFYLCLCDVLVVM